MNHKVPALDRAGMNADQYRKFCEKITKDKDCWVWIAARGGSHSLYGVFGVSGKMRYAHRLSYELWVGELPDGLSVCHKCDNPSCVNPAHLWLGTTKQNQQDMVAKGRSLRGERHNMAKLDETDVLAIRSAYSSGTCRLCDIGRKYKVAESTVSLIVNRLRWTHVP